MNDILVDAIVSVIVPTLASSQRAELLKRAVASIRASSLHPIRIIVVVNGTRFDKMACEWLKAQPDVQFEQVAEPSLPNAVLSGRNLVKTEFFSCLDDDDEYLKDATDQKVALLQAHPEADIVVTNSYQRSAGVDSLLYDSLPDVAGSPLESLMRFGWLTSGNALFRAGSVGTAYFENYHPYAEWTWLAFKLMMDKKTVRVLNEPTCRYNNTAVSLSKTDAYFSAYIPLFKRMLGCTPPKHVVQMIRRKMGAAYHDASAAALCEGRRSDAWKYHVQSLFMTNGLRYLSYTRHLFK